MAIGKSQDNVAAVAPGGKKRALIRASEKNIFIWLAFSSVIVSICLVASQFLFREFMFNQKVIDVKAATNKRLQDNIKNAEKLKTDMNKLITNEGLVALGAQAGGGSDNRVSNLKVILDALPVQADATGFANSLQTVVLPSAGVSITELPIISTGASETGTTSNTNDSTKPLAMPFQVTFSGDYAAVSKAFSNINHVIRPINVTDISMRVRDNKQLAVSLKGDTYYLPSKSVVVKTIQCKEDSKDCKK